MRLINEDDVLEIIERVTNEAVEKKQPKYLIQPRIIAEISGLPTIEAEPVNGWISVKDRLPDGDGNVYEGGLEESKYVLVYGCYEDDYGYGIGTYIRDHIDHDAGWSGCLSGVYELDCCNVTHWQHLPEPPKGE